MNAKRIGARIQEVRRMRGLTQASLAQKADLTPKYLSNIECGEKLPKLETFLELTNALRTDANTLLQDVLEVSPELRASWLAERLKRLPQKEQRRLLHLFDLMITDAEENL